MWILMNDGFVSVVAHKDKSDWLLVRARKRGHIAVLFPNRPITANAGTDYKFRLTVSRKMLAEVIASRIEAIDYKNFKNSVADRKLHDLYLRFWDQGIVYQDGPSAYSPGGRLFPYDIDKLSRPGRKRKR